MIILLREADFSANNLGKIDFNRELNADTKALLANYSLPLTTVQKNAVDDFLLGLRSSGVYKKITCLLLPCLAANIDEAMVNAITNTNMGTLNPEYWLLRNKGLVQTSVTYGTEEAITRIEAYVDVPINNNHYAVFNSENYEFINNSDTARQFPTRRNAGTTFYDNMTSASESFWLNGCKYGGVEISAINGEFEFGVQQLHQINLNGNTLSVKHGEGDINSVVSDVSLPSTHIDAISICGNGNNGIKAHALYSFGYAMTDEEQISYARLVKDLMSVLL